MRWDKRSWQSRHPHKICYRLWHQCPNHSAKYIQSLSPKVIRASAGSIFHLPIISCSHREAIEYLKTRQIQLLCADAYGDRDLSKCDLRSATAIVLGNESHGPTAEIKGASRYRVSIPMVQNTESLNVAVAGSIFLYEAMIQRKNQTRPSHTHCGKIKGFANLMTGFKEEG